MATGCSPAGSEPITAPSASAAPVTPMSGGQTEKQVQLIQDLKPRIIMVTPSYVLNIADEMERAGIDPRQCSLKIGIFGAEPWTNQIADGDPAPARLDAIDIYGLSEIMGPGVANECIETKDGLVIWEDFFYPEIIDPETGEVLPEGEKGELVITCLSKEALPMIRYRTRDLTRLLPPTARSMRRLEKITGRSDDMLIIRGVNVFPTQIEELALKMPEFAPTYQLVVTREGHMDKLEVNVETRPQSAQEFMTDPAKTANLAKHLQDAIKTMVGVSTTVNVLLPNSIEHSSGKAKRVIDKRYMLTTDRERRLDEASKPQGALTCA